MLCDPLAAITTLAVDEELIPIAIFVVGGIVAVVAIVTEAVRKSMHTRQREQSRLASIFIVRRQCLQALIFNFHANCSPSPMRDLANPRGSATRLGQQTG